MKVEAAADRKQAKATPYELSGLNSSPNVKRFEWGRDRKAPGRFHFWQAKKCFSHK
jgi:hypothetical protein